MGTYAYCDAKGSYPPVHGYNAGSAWCGDQGLILGGLLDYLRVDPTNPIAQPQAVSIAGGVLYHMVTDHVVQPTLNLTNDPDDYGCGSGVFWRYLLHGFRTNAALRQQVLSWVNADRANNAIYRSAEYACANGGPGNALFADFNVLATLTAAIEILSSGGSIRGHPTIESVLERRDHRALMNMSSQNIPGRTSLRGRQVPRMSR